MPRYLIERNLPNVGSFSAEQMQSFARLNCSVIKDMDSQIQWVESFVTANKLYCVYLAPDKASLVQHAAIWDVPANRIEEVMTVISPVTAEYIREKV